MRCRVWSALLVLLGYVSDGGAIIAVGTPHTFVLTAPSSMVSVCVKSLESSGLSSCQRLSVEAQTRQWQCDLPALNRAAVVLLGDSPLCRANVYTVLLVRQAERSGTHPFEVNTARSKGAWSLCATPLLRWIQPACAQPCVSTNGEYRCALRAA